MSRLTVNLNPHIHKPLQPNKYSAHAELKCELLQDTNAIVTEASVDWISGREFLIDTEMFRGKGTMITDQRVVQRQYRDKHSIIRVVGHFKKEVNLDQLWMGGAFEKGVKNLPASWITNIGIQIARSKSHHFCIRVSQDQPFVAVPFLCLIDTIRIIPYDGQSASLWRDFDLSQPIVEDWAAQMPDEVRAQFQVTQQSPGSHQQAHRHRLRTLPPSQWTSFPLRENKLLAFELLDSALMLENFTIHWKFANVLPISLDMKKHITHLPFSLFVVERTHRSCACTGPKKKHPSLAIPSAWQKEGMCEMCFPPQPEKKPEQFVFALSVCSSKKKKQLK